MGQIGIFDSPSALLKWAVAGPDLIKILDHFLINPQHDINSDHHEASASKEKALARDVNAFLDVMKHHGNPFRDPSDKLKHLTNGTIIENLQANQEVMNAEQNGIIQYKEFCSRMDKEDLSIHDPIRLNKLKLFSGDKVKKISKEKLAIANLKVERNLFSSLFVACQARGGDLDTFFKHEHHNYPVSISTFGKLSECTKADVLQIFEKIVPARLEPPESHVIVVDTAVMVQANHPKISNTYGQYCFEEFPSKMLGILKNSKVIHFVFDQYFSNSIKQCTRESRGAGSGPRVAIKKDTKINDFKTFLLHNDNKDDLFKLLSEGLRTYPTEKSVICTVESGVISNEAVADVDLAPCNHEEADTRLFVHVIHAYRQGHKTVTIKTVDTDVVVIAAYMYPDSGLQQLWIDFGFGKYQRWISVHDLCSKLGKSKCSALPFWYAFTGCDTVSILVGRAKKTNWDTWNAMPEMTEKFTLLSKKDSLDDDDMTSIQKYVVHVYDKNSELELVNTCRRNLFIKKGRSVENCPPTLNALTLHTLRAMLQSRYYSFQNCSVR